MSDNLTCPYCKNEEFTAIGRTPIVTIDREGSLTTVDETIDSTLVDQFFCTKCRRPVFLESLNSNYKLV